jgi:hypothetical protein
MIMLKIDLKSEVRKVVAGEWEQFAAAHPRLAAVVDQELLVEEAMASIGDDPGYRQAIETASTTGLLTATVAQIVRGFVADWLKRLL